MGNTFTTNLGDPLLLVLNTFDNSSGLHPQAVICDSSGTEVSGSAFNLTEISGAAEYRSSDYTPSITGTYTAKFISYTDAAHLTESTVHGRDTDVFLVTNNVWDELNSSHNTTGTMGALQNQTEILRALTENNWELSGNQMVFYGDDGVTPFRIFNLFDTEGDTFSSEADAPAKRILTSSLP